jgi:hypothetical protein
VWGELAVSAVEAGDEVIFEGLDCPLGWVEPMVVWGRELIFLEALGGDGVDEGTRGFVI